MKIKHPAIKSEFFKIIGTYEIDISLGTKDDEDVFTLRLELSQSTLDKTLYRYKAWRSEFFRIQSTFPQDESGFPQHAASDETLLVAYSQPHFPFYGELTAVDQAKALKKILDNFAKSLEYITLEKVR